MLERSQDTVVMSALRTQEAPRISKAMEVPLLPDSVLRLIGVGLIHIERSRSLFGEKGICKPLAREGTDPPNETLDEQVEEEPVIDIPSILEIYEDEDEQDEHPKNPDNNQRDL